MPELPEVETLRRELAAVLPGKRILDVSIAPQSLRRPLPHGFAERLTGAAFVEIRRRGKFLIFVLDSQDAVLWHLGMSGRFWLLPADAESKLHEHVYLALDDCTSLRYVDARRFGFAGLCPSSALADHPWLTALGPEPFSPAFSSSYLMGRMQARRVAIKSLLMNGAVVAGVGNIYANEALFRAGIHPDSAAAGLDSAAAARLVESLKSVLREAILACGSSIATFARIDGTQGKFAQYLRVYGREGLACVRCGGPIVRGLTAGRSSFYCPGCQPRM